MSLLQWPIYLNALSGRDEDDLPVVWYYVTVGGRRFLAMQELFLRSMSNLHASSTSESKLWRKGRTDLYWVEESLLVSDSGPHYPILALHKVWLCSWKGVKVQPLLLWTVQCNILHVLPLLSASRITNCVSAPCSASSKAVRSKWTILLLITCDWQEMFKTNTYLLGK